MRPFYETTNERTGRVQRVHWDAEVSHQKREEMRQECIDFLNRRDIERARAAGINLPEDAKYLPTAFDGGKGEMVIDPIAVRIKHSGAELNDMFIPKWQEFCSRPQYPDESSYPKPVYKSKQPPRNGNLSDVQAAPVSVVNSYDVPVRKPGRPRKQQMQEI